MNKAPKPCQHRETRIVPIKWRRNWPFGRNSKSVRSEPPIRGIERCAKESCNKALFKVNLIQKTRKPIKA